MSDTMTISPAKELVEQLKTNRNLIIEKIETAAQGKTKPLLLAVSKKQPIAKLAALMLCGQKHFGENYLQEAIDKQQRLKQWLREQPDESLKNLAIQWHYIGNVQSNKTRQIAQNFNWVHCITSTRQLIRLNQHADPALGPVNVCIQINTDDEPQKQGITANELPELIHCALEMDRLCLRGLMCLPALSNSSNSFEKLATLFHQVKNGLIDQPTAWNHFDTLSMGTSNDLLTAIAAGSTIVRVGTSLFGARQSTD